MLIQSRLGCRFKTVVEGKTIVNSEVLDHRCRMVDAGVPSLLGMGLEDGHVPTLKGRLRLHVTVYSCIVCT